MTWTSSIHRKPINSSTKQNQKTRGELRCSEIVSNSCSTSGTRCVTHRQNLVESHNRVTVLKLLRQYNRNIVESGVKHHNPNPFYQNFVFYFFLNKRMCTKSRTYYTDVFVFVRLFHFKTFYLCLNVTILAYNS